METTLHTPALAKSVKRGEFVRFKVDGPVYVRGDYDRETRTYCFSKCDDMNASRNVKGSKKLFVGFTY